MDDELAAIRDTFFQECEDQLSELESGLMALEQGAGDRETVNAVFRAVHSVKGGAGAFGLEALVRFAHLFEAALDHLRAGRLTAGPAVVAVLLRAADGLTDLVRARGGSARDEARIHLLEAELAEINRGANGGAPPAALVLPAAIPAELTGVPPPPAAPAASLAAFRIRFEPRPGLYANANESLVLLRELERLGQIEVTLDTTRLPDLACLDPEGAYLAWDIVLHANCAEEAIRAVFEFAEDDCTLFISTDHPACAADPPAEPMAEFSPPSALDIEALINAARAAEDPEPAPAAAPPLPAPALVAPPPAAAPVAAAPVAPPPPAAPPPQAAAVQAAVAPGATIRVDLDRVDRMIDLVGELVINGSMLSQRVMEAGLSNSAGIEAALDDLGRITREIQDSVMAIRAQPVRSVFQRMPRLVREVASMTGKQVRLVTEGESTEVDKTVIERIVDPLTHMIRNAIDHGLESPRRRAETGKPAEGVVKLAALHRSGRIVIQVEDDGGGIDRERVRAKAIQNGVIAADAQLTDEEIDNLIFLPGFSTASTVSDISGRGVGMDVVRRSVQALGGRISIASRPGRGSTFTLSLPLTLAVLDGMVVSVAGHTLIVPLSTMIEATRPQPGAIQCIGPDTQVVMMRGGCVPLIDVGLALGYRHQPADPENCVAVLVEGGGSARALLLLDAIHGQRQVVIKSLEANYRAIPGIAAATVMGDGKVALILDVDKIISSYGEAAAEPRLALAG